MAMISGQLNALLEGQQKILEELHEIRKTLRELEERMILQHEMVLSRLSDIEDQIRINRRLIREDLYGNFHLCKNFYRRLDASWSDSEQIRLLTFKLRRDFWVRCEASLHRLMPGELVSQAFLFRAAADDVSEVKGERPASELYLDSVAWPILDTLRSRDDLDALVSHAAFWNTTEQRRPSEDPGSFAEAFSAQSGWEALQRDALLSPTDLVEFSHVAFRHAETWLDGSARLLLDEPLEAVLRPQDYEVLASREVSLLLRSLIRLLNVATAQQQILAGQQLLEPSREVDGAYDWVNLPVSLKTLEGLLTPSRYNLDAYQLIASHLLHRWVSHPRDEITSANFWDVRDADDWASELNRNAGGFYFLTLEEDGSQAQVALEFSQDNEPCGHASAGPCLIVRSKKSPGLDSIERKIPLAMGKGAPGAGSGPEHFHTQLSRSPMLMNLVQVRAEALRWVALAGLNPTQRQALLRAR